jgi:hypothetical protein
MVKKLSAKKKGEYAELCFAAASSLRGLIVSFPGGDSAKYDFVIDNGKKLYKVQVKSTSRIATKNIKDPSYNFVAGSGHSSKKAYLEKDIDFVVCVELVTMNYYIIPINKLKSVKVTVRPASSNCKNKLYKNNWQLLTT